MIKAITDTSLDNIKRFDRHHYFDSAMTAVALWNAAWLKRRTIGRRCSTSAASCSPSTTSPCVSRRRRCPTPRCKGRSVMCAARLHSRREYTAAMTEHRVPGPRPRPASASTHAPPRPPVPTSHAASTPSRAHRRAPSAPLHRAPMPPAGPGIKFTQIPRVRPKSFWACAVSRSLPEPPAGAAGRPSPCPAQPRAAP